MEKINSITVLGSGTSTGVPTLGCECSVCTSTNPKNKRYRSSICLHFNDGQNLLIDASTDLRSQLLANKINKIDAAIITHEHADHTHGIDDLRPFCFYRKDPIPVFALNDCSQVLADKFPYIFQREEVFKNKKILGGGIPKLDLYNVSPGTENILGYDFTFFSLKHGHTTTLAFCVDKFAYIIDCQEVPQETLDFLKNQNLDLLIIDCLRTKPHQTHLHFDRSIEYAKFIGAKKTGLTHLSHEFDQEELTNKLVEMNLAHIFPLYDTQVLSY
jgi:phosphoribosyl 1,2-cyclic phosphate phosphodiesterase